MDNLPDHILEKILARLPIKDGVKLNYVCKNWKSLCSTAHFLYLQAQFSSPILLELQDNWTLSIVETYSMGSSDKKNGVMKTPVFKKLNGSLCSRITKLVAYGDGFLLFSIRNNGGHGFLIWNPLTGCTKTIPPPCIVSPISSTAVVFDKKSQCCKVIIVQQQEDGIETWIYNSNKDEWKKILLPQEASSQYTEWYWRGVYHISKGGLEPSRVMKFDVEGEKWVWSGEISNTSLHDVVGYDKEEELFAITKHPRDTFFRFFKMVGERGVGMRWVQCQTIQQPSVYGTCAFENGLALFTLLETFSARYVPLVTIKEKLLTKGKFSIQVGSTHWFTYDLQDKTWTTFQIQESSELLHFVPTLLPIQSTKHSMKLEINVTLPTVCFDLLNMSSSTSITLTW